jgi:lipopolysaccharide cholinephosphotransferase
MKELTLREVQLGELAVAKQLDEICRKLNLRYWLMYGTLLGAVRHQGFIPWDDDVDVMMPRPDYEKLIDYLIAHAEEIAPLKLMHYRTNKDYIYPIARLSDSRYHIKYNKAKDYGLGLFVDIYPLDGGGNTPEEAEGILRAQQFDLSMALLAGTDKYYSSASHWIRNAPKFLAYLYAKARGANHYARKLDLNGQKYSYEDSKYVAQTNWDSWILVYEKEWFDHIEYMQFEDTMLCVPKEYDKILTQTFGDYMTPPPEDKRIAQHDYVAYLKDSEA